MALFLFTLLGGNWLLRQPVEKPKAVGLDFIAFYTAGTFVRDGHADRMYDLNAVRTFQHDLAARYGVDIGQACGPWWNPPFYALVFVPLARLDYLPALAIWLAVNLACAATAIWLMTRMLPRETGWRSWALVPLLVVLSTPFIHALSHAQNTCVSLLLLTGAVMLWRSERALLAGLVGGLLFYKPQLATIVAVVMVFDLGWRAAAGFTITGVSFLAITLFALPATLGEFIHRVPQNLDLVQTHTVYLWERHATFKAFWRLLLQGRSAGATTFTVQAFTIASIGAIATALAWAAFQMRMRFRTSGQNPAIAETIFRDRLVAAAIVSSPLLVPFYFDYDQLLLSIAAVLFAAELMTRRGEHLSRVDRWLLVLWPLYYVWLMLNPDVAEHTRLSLTVPLLACIAGLMISRAAGPSDPLESNSPLARI